MIIPRMISPLSAFVIAAVVVAGVLAQDGYKNDGPKCHWVGHSPFCFGSCPYDFVEVARIAIDPGYGAFPGYEIATGFGRRCVTGRKKLCCDSYYGDGDLGLRVQDKDKDKGKGKGNDKIVPLREGYEASERSGTGKQPIPPFPLPPRK